MPTTSFHLACPRSFTPPFLAETCGRFRLYQSRVIELRISNPPPRITLISTRLWELYVPLPPPRTNTFCGERSDHPQLPSQWSPGWEFVPIPRGFVPPSLTDQFGDPRWGSRKPINVSSVRCTPSDTIL